MTARTPQPPQRLSLQLDTLLDEILETTTMTDGRLRRRLEQIADVLREHVSAARSLETMLERRLKATSVPWRTECQAAPAVSADVVQFAPRGSNVRRLPKRPGNGDAA